VVKPGSNVITFGAFIRWKHDAPPTILGAESVRPRGLSVREMSDRGTRHHSAAWLAGAIDALVCVKSQDGALSMFLANKAKVKSGVPRVWLWEDVEPDSVEPWNPTKLA